MAYKNKQDPRAKLARDKWYINNKNKQMSRQKQRREELRKWYWNYKKELFCTDCKISFKDHPEICDFHHLGIYKKESEVSIKINSSKEMFLKELNKCVPLCSNCHRIRHGADLYKHLI